MPKQVDDNGYWLIEGNPITKEGVFPYLGRTISPRLEPDKIYQVYRPYAELANPETLKSFDGIPLIEDHEMLGDGFTSTDDRPPQGILMNPRADNGMLVGDLKIFSDAMKDRIEGGKKELSLGYKCRYDITPGEWNGQHYDAIQTDLRGNHIALVAQGRMGHDVRVYDCWACDALEITTKPTKESSDMDNPEKEKKEPETPAKDESVDKRKLIDEIGGILKDKVSEEILRAIIGKAEKIAYNASEAGKGTDEDENKPDDEKKDDAEGKDACGKDACGKDEDKPEEKSEEKKDEEKGEDADKCGKDEFFDGPKMERTVRGLVEKGEISEEIGKKILGSERYTRGGMDEADYIRANDQRNALYAKVSKIVGDFAMDGMTALDVAKFAAKKLNIAGTVEAVEAYCAAAEKHSRCVEVAADAAPKSRKPGELSEKMKAYISGK